jgi:uncharacterized membrane protein YdbT with pleckstrin-like domain
MTIIWQGKSNSIATMASGGKLVTGKYRITTDFVYLDTGVLTTTGEQIPMWAIRDCDVKQNLMQKARGVADLRLICEHNDFTGKREFVLQDIQGALEVRDLVNQHSKAARIAHETQQKAQVVNYSGTIPVPQSTPAVEDDSLAKLERLGAVLEKGLITQEEFSAQKAKLLGM